MTRRPIYFIAFILCATAHIIISCQPANSDQTEQKEDTWTSMFNGENLDGWTPKIAGFPAGENWKNTFVVEDGLLKVNYTEYDTFQGEFGHLFYETPFSRYRMRLEYRFVGDQPKGGAGWAFRNNGIMFHSQSVESMGQDQAFPVSLEFQFLGGDGSGNERTTGCLCTPGLHVTVADTLERSHCIPNDGPTIDGDGWVIAELYADGGEEIHHIINGDTVFSYSNPVVGGQYLPEGYEMAEGTKVTGGYIALQGETAPIHFRKIEIQELED